MIDDPHWTCHVCGRMRPDATISVITTCVGKDYGLAAEVLKQNVRYCNDEPECVEAAKTKRLFKPTRTNHEP